MKVSSYPGKVPNYDLSWTGGSFQVPHNDNSMIILCCLACIDLYGKKNPWQNMDNKQAVRIKTQIFFEEIVSSPVYFFVPEKKQLILPLVETPKDWAQTEVKKSDFQISNKNAKILLR